MKLNSLSQSHFNTVIIGGGIVGAGIFRDLTLNGVETLLIDAWDFSSQTSQSSSKMLHGGIRYLENFDFELVFEALHEKNLWIKIAPHLAREIPFYFPVYKNSKRPLWMLSVGLLLYDLLSGFKNSPFSIKNKKETLATLKNLNPETLRGAGIYYDAIIDDAKLTLEIIYDGLNHAHAHAQNYTELISAEVVNDVNFLTLKNKITQEVYVISAKHVVYALGPFTDKVLTEVAPFNWEPILLPSKGSHLWFSRKDLPLEEAIVMTPHDEYGDRVIFVIPHDDKVLVGTTEVKTDENNISNLTPSDDEVKYLLKNINLYFPNLNLEKEHILASFSGIRPLVREDNAGNNRGKTSRLHKVYQPLSSNYVIAGGKYTTFRVMGQEIARLICHQNSRNYMIDKTLAPLSKTSVVQSFDWHLPSKEELKAICENEMPRTFKDLLNRRLSIASRKMWAQKTDRDFDHYFLEHFDLLAQYIKISKEDIKAVD